MAVVEFEHIKPEIGSIVHVDRKDILNPEVAILCREEVEKRTAIVFPEVNLTDEEQLAFTDNFGERINFSKNAPGGGESDVYHITLDKDKNPHPEYVHGTFFWHIDGMTINQPLPKYTLLSARKLSETGGQTEFANLYAAFEALSAAEKEAYEDARVIHTIAASIRDVVAEVNEDTVALLNVAVDMERPLIWKHHDGRKSLLVGSHADRIVGMELPQARAILRRLLEWAGREEFVYQHNWKVGDFAIWDNCGAMHRVVPYDGESGRMMHRTSIAGGDREVAQ